MAEHMTDTRPDHAAPAALGTVPAALGTLLDVVLDDDMATGGRTRPPALLAAAFACALATAVLAGSVGAAPADAAAPEVAASR